MAQVYDLPRGWRWVELNKVAPVQTNSVEPNIKPDEQYNYLSLEHIESTTGRLIDFKPTLGSEIHSAKITFTRKHVLYGKLRPYLNKVFVPNFDGICTPELVPLLPESEVILRNYLAWYLRSSHFVDYAMRNITGTRMPRVSMRALKSAQIPLPPLDEQKRIVARIEELARRIEEAKRLRQESFRQAQSLLPSALHKVFSQAEKKGWKWARLKEIIQKPQYGYTSPAQNKPVGPKMLRITDIQNGKVNWGSVPYCKINIKDFKKYQLKKGDILFARSGATTGKTFLVEDCPEAVFASYLIRIKVLKELAIPKYIHAFFQSPQYWEQIKPRGGAQPNMNAKVLSELLLPIPSLDEQRRVVEYLDSIQSKAESLKRLQEETQKELDTLLPSILDRAFRGEL